MQSLFKPFVAIDTPVRYFFALFIMYLGGLHLADDFKFLYGDAKHTDIAHILGLALAVTIITFISHYFAQRKTKKKIPPIIAL